MSRARCRERRRESERIFSKWFLASQVCCSPACRGMRALLFI
ncbi:ST-I family heat-stable enterotoxin [Paenibacillus sp. MWE-103]|uniref:ST-I family heat-stable enterotoxin n=1 Tax=Paenibacillus artemisiicola TaxID=1172618 RepID=A0ABS3WHA1_9BACL|nr:ST-I family heat-stable enterotoxin [Paenibacillus artemisiicola]